MSFLGGIGAIERGLNLAGVNDYRSESI